MPRADNSGGGGGTFSHLGSVPITAGFAGTVIIALMLLIVLRHLFASVNVSAGTR